MSRSITGSDRSEGNGYPGLTAMREPPTMPPPMHAPWQYLDKHHPNVTVHLLPLADRWGETVWDGPRIRINLALDLSAIQHRCTLAHEITHVKHGAPCQSLCPDNEARVVEDTAAWLLPDLDELGAALADYDLDTAAAELLVTRKVLLDRIHYLTDEELAVVASHIRTPDPAELAAAHPTEHIADDPDRRRFPARRAPHVCKPARRGRT